MKHPVLIVLHQEHSTPGRIGNTLRSLGYPLDIRRPRFGDPLPDTMERHAGAVIFGGPMSANDTDDFIRREIEWIELPLKESKPYLGICLGAQMLAHLLGARVSFHPEGKVEIGYYPVFPTDLGRKLCSPWPEHVYQWHREGFDLPSGADLIAAGDVFPVQAFHFGTAHALQFHPDVTHATMCRWTTRGHERMQLPGAKSRAEHFADRAVHDLAARGWLASFVDHWLNCGTACAPPAAIARLPALPRAVQASPSTSAIE